MKKQWITPVVLNLAMDKTTNLGYGIQTMNDQGDFSYRCSCCGYETGWYDDGGLAETALNNHWQEKHPNGCNISSSI